AVHQQIGDLHEGRILGQLVDRIAAVEQDPGLAVDIGDGALAAGGRGEARVVGEHPGLAVEFADVDDLRPDRPVEDRIAVVGPGDVQGRGLVGHSFGSIWSAMRARLSSRPSNASTSKIPGDVVRPVRAARNGWAILPSLTLLLSATSRMAASSDSASHFARAASLLCAAARMARASGVRRIVAA